MYEYKAKDHSGKIVKAVSEADNISDATREIKNKGLKLISLKALQRTHDANQVINEDAIELQAFIFKAQDKNGEATQGTIQGTDEESVRKMLEEDFKYQVSSIHKKSEPKPGKSPEVIQASKAQVITTAEGRREIQAKKASGDSSIIFSKQPQIIHRRADISEDELIRVHSEVQYLLSEKGARISEKSRNLLLHLDGKIDLIRDSKNKKHWRKLKSQIRKARKMAEKDIKAYENKKWQSYDEKSGVKTSKPLAELVEKKKRILFKPGGKLARVANAIRCIDNPNQDNSREVNLKETYESVWAELQRFSGALFIFYIICFFVAYYLKRSGMEDQFLVRIYETTLFKQLVIVLFAFYALLSFRLMFLAKRVKSDGAVMLLWLLTVWGVF